MADYADAIERESGATVIDREELKTEATAALAQRLERMTRVVAVVAVCVAVTVAAITWWWYARADAELGLPEHVLHAGGLIAPLGGRVRAVLAWAMLSLFPMYVVFRLSRAAVLRAFVSEAGVLHGLERADAHEVVALFR